MRGSNCDNTCGCECAHDKGTLTYTKDNGNLRKFNKIKLSDPSIHIPVS